jgi:UDP-galactopyranose mutase
VKHDYLIVGAGFSGCVLAERIATQLGKRCLIVEKRDHIGGNAYDCYDGNGIMVHKYGPHIFHTNSKRVVDYLSQFTEWIPYFHRVVAEVEGKKVPVPFNLNSLYRLFPQKDAERLEGQLAKSFGYDQKIPILKLRESSSGELKSLADYIYGNIFYGYTLKQWECKPEELDPSVTARVPVYISRDDRYFQDTYQLMPRYGYAKMFERMLSNKNIHLTLQTDFKGVENGGAEFDKVIYTGPIDEFFGYIHGELPYRSLRFEFQNLNQEFFQEVGTVNYPNGNLYTRITEFKYLTGQEHGSTTVAYEYPERYKVGENLPYYPIPKTENKVIFNKYEEEKKTLKNVIFCGRLADYIYYNMDQIVARALTVFEKEICR